MKTRILALIFLVACSMAVLAEPSIVVRGLLKDMLVMEVDGVQRILKAGKTSPEGITLIAADTKRAVVEIDGQRQELTLTRRIGGGEYKAPERAEVRIARGVGAHYFTPGRINNQPVNFLVDTGATSVSMNSLIAQKLRIDYTKGVPVRMSTASGVAQGYRVLLSSVAVGTVQVNNVEAVVTEGAYPTEILLGNSYLAQVEMKIDAGVLVLQSKF